MSLTANTKPESSDRSRKSVLDFRASRAATAMQTAKHAKHANNSAFVYFVYFAVNPFS